MSRYRPARSDASRPPPAEWLGEDWAARYPYLPPFAEMLRTGRMVLPFDAVNEMPYASEADYRERVGLWRTFVADLVRTAPGNRVVFSCRSLDYSESLSTPELAVPHVRIERLSDEQVESFLSAYSPEHGQAIWHELRGTPQFDLFRSPFYLKLLLAQSGPDGKPPAGRAALFTGFVRQALARKVETGNDLSDQAPCSSVATMSASSSTPGAIPTICPQGARCSKRCRRWPSRCRSTARAVKPLKCG